MFLSSTELKCQIHFAIYLPPKTDNGKCPVLYWLSGLTCMEQNFITNAGSQKAASEHGTIIVAPDTSTRGCNIEGKNESWDFGTEAGFYVNATQEPWKSNYRMYAYVRVCLLFATICNPSQKVFNGYLGKDKAAWEV
ncbi:S-formylglutathione hydrolase-like [Oncorhynchus masou masou]|uniref:S-formylglutathione hydrolase-like n=1 Tax=Oncorhynchus masou masou TaxID=90313 RepID=UPI003183BC42